ncbi:MAG: RNA-binding protein [Gammaproteobacteria bacterium]|nr:RNA-binding protein [Gammaproteobacteria bacterium]MDE2344874.1 RNA-binding protein [Gammaproteobacteria bacterium]
MKKMFVGGLPSDATEGEIRGMFEQYGKVFSISLVHDIFKGTCKGFGFVEMEGHEARAALAALNGHSLRGSMLKVNEEDPKSARGRNRRRH